jgi:ubiquinone/menaquinone biosynthesis C-methylase UbiE
MTSYTTTSRYQRCQHIFDRAYPQFCNAGERYEDHIRAVLDETTHVLDVGCGRGSLAEKTIQKSTWSVGIDLVHNDLMHNTTVQSVAVANAGALPFANDSFEVLVSQWVVEHFNAPKTAFSEMARVLKSDGHLVFLTTNARNYIPLLSRLIPERVRRFILEKILRRPAHESFPTFYRANSRRAIQKIAAHAGFTVEKIDYVANPFYFAFNVPLFRIALFFEKITDWKPLNFLKLYMVVTLRKK